MLSRHGGASALWMCRGHREEAVELRTKLPPPALPPSFHIPVLACPYRHQHLSHGIKALDCSTVLHHPSTHLHSTSNTQPTTNHQPTIIMSDALRKGLGEQASEKSTPFSSLPLPSPSLTPLQSPPTPRSRPPRRPARACLAPVTALPEPSSLVRPSIDPPFLIHSLTHHRGPEEHRPEGR
jgi:hypothetical protein